MTNTERVAYIRGLMEGLNLDENKDEVKVLNAMLDLLDEMASDLAGLDETVDEVAGQVDEIDEDLAALEDEIYGEEEDDEEEDELELELELGSSGAFSTMWKTKRSSTAAKSKKSTKAVAINTFLLRKNLQIFFHKPDNCLLTF